MNPTNVIPFDRHRFAVPMAQLPPDVRLERQALVAHFRRAMASGLFREGTAEILCDLLAQAERGEHFGAGGG